MSAYTDFVRANVGRMPGKTQQERMRQVAAAWRKHKGTQRGRGADGESDAPSGETRARIVAPAGGDSNHAPRHGRLFKGGYFRGGSADSALRAANQGSPELVGGGPLGDLFPPLKMLGLGHYSNHSDHRAMHGGKFSFKDFMSGVKDVAGVVSQVAPVAMKLAPLIL